VLENATMDWSIDFHSQLWLNRMKDYISGNLLITELDLLIEPFLLRNIFLLFQIVDINCFSHPNFVLNLKFLDPQLSITRHSLSHSLLFPRSKFQECSWWLKWFVKMITVGVTWVTWGRGRVDSGIRRGNER